MKGAVPLAMAAEAVMFGLAVLGRTGFSREALDGIVDTTLASLEA